MFRETISSQNALTDSAASAKDGPSYAALLLDAAYRILSCGRAASDLFGYPARVLIGQPITMLLPDIDALFTAQGRRDMSIQLSKVRLDGLRADGTRLRILVSLLDDHTSDKGRQLLCIRAIAGPH